MKKKKNEKFHSDREMIFDSMEKSPRYSKENLEKYVEKSSRYPKEKLEKYIVRAAYLFMGIVALFFAIGVGLFSYLYGLILLFVDWYIFGLKDACHTPLSQLTLGDIFGVIGGLFVRLSIGFVVYSVISGIVESFKKEEFEEY